MRIVAALKHITILFFSCFIPINIFCVPIKRQIDINDEIITYYISVPKKKSFSCIALLMVGSSCKSCYGAHKWFEQLALEQGFGLITVEKRGIDNQTINTKKYLEQNTIHQQVHDIKHILDSLILENWDGSIIIIGGSEGAMVGALLTEECAAITKASILIAGVGSYNFYKEADLLIDKNCEAIKFGKFISYAIKAYYRLAMLYAHQFPNSTMKLFGHTLKSWISFERATYMILSSLEKVSVPLYIIHGKNDLMALYESGEDLYKQLKSKGKIVAFKTLDEGHNLNEHLDQIIKDALCWLKNQFLI